MRNPPRPTAIVAAVVCLFVVAGESFLTVVGLMAWWFLPGDETIRPLLPLFALVLSVFGGWFLIVGVRALAGSLRRPTETAKEFLIVAGLAGIPVLITLGICLAHLSGEDRPFTSPYWTDTPPSTFVGYLLLWSGTAALALAAWLLWKYADRYNAWRASLQTGNRGYGA